MRTIVVSDIHIGNNHKTCWYQRSLHEPYMVELLEYVLRNANKGSDPIDRLVILGDLFDFWTYPADMVPPSLDEIVAANPTLFGPGGKLAQVVEALNGSVYYLRGNHDITLSQDDLDRIPTGEHKIRMLPDVYADPSGVVFTHGHLATLFNAPDPRYPGQVPVGHFVTRAISSMLERTLRPGQTAADLHDQGSPYGFSLPSLIPGLAGFLTSPSITSILLDYIAKRCELPEGRPIKMADGKALTIDQAKAKYDGLFTLWAERNGGGEAGLQIAAKAALADYNGQYMGWFAQRFAFANNASGVVMGHTHTPKVGIEGSWCNYVNTGFECPSRPDVDDGKMSWNFATVDAKGEIRLMQVVKEPRGYSVQPASAPKDRVVRSPSMDFSCYVRIVNNGPTDLLIRGQREDEGSFVVPPPSRIPIGGKAEIWLQDKAGIHGSKGSVAYAADGQAVEFAFACPTGIFSNKAKGGAELVASAGSPPPPDAPRNKVPSGGHPLFVEFYAATGGARGREARS